MQTIDIATIHDCQQGDRDAFRRIYEAYHKRIYALAYRYTHDPEEALDLTQEIFLRVYTGIANFRGECSLETWLYRIAVNTAISAIRKSRPHEPLTKEIENRPDSAPLADAQLEAHELEQHLERAIAALPDSLRLAFVLVAVEHRPYAEVADILGLRVEAVRMRVSRARQLLRVALQPYL
jgi:RNA polymerase sigma-70 factor (ECF subfamily)